MITADALTTVDIMTVIDMISAEKYAMSAQDYFEVSKQKGPESGASNL